MTLWDKIIINAVIILDIAFLGAVLHWVMVSL
jgi:hypothetical protein